MLKLGETEIKRKQINYNVIKTVQRRKIRVIDERTKIAYEYNSIEEMNKAEKEGKLKPAKYQQYIEVLSYTRLEKREGKSVFNIEYMVTSVKTKDGKERYFNTVKDAEQFCNQQKIKETRNKNNSNNFKELLYKAPLRVMYEGDDKDIAANLYNSGELTMDDVKLYQYYAGVKVFNDLVWKVEAYLKKEGLYRLAEKKGMQVFLADYIFDRELVDGWVNSEAKEGKYASTEYYRRMFNFFKESDIITVCGAGYVLNNFYQTKGIAEEDEMELQRIAAVLENTDFKNIVI